MWESYGSVSSRHEGPVHEGPEARLEDRPAEGLGPRPERRGIKTHALQRVNGGAERGRPSARGRRRRSRRRPPTPAPPPSREDDRRPAAGHGLEGHDAEVLDAGHDHRPAAAVEVAQRARRRRAPRNSTSGGASARSRASSGPLPTILQRPAGAAVGLEHQLDPLVGREGRDHEVVGAGRVAAGREEVGVHGRRDHLRVAAVVAADAAGHVARCWRRSGATRGGGGHVPGAQALGDRGRSRARAAGATRPRAEVVVVAVPDVAHRRVAVADVQRARRARARPWPRSASWRSRGRSRRGRWRRRRRGRAAGSGGSGAPTPGRRCTKVVRISRASSSGRHASPCTCSRVKIGRVGEEAGEREEHLLAAAHPGQPVVDEAPTFSALPRPRTARHGRAQHLHVAGVDGAHRALPAEVLRRARGRARPARRAARRRRARAPGRRRCPRRCRGRRARAASPTTSGSDEMREVTTGVPQAMASSGGRPKPS